MIIRMQSPAIRVLFAKRQKEFINHLNNSFILCNFAFFKLIIFIIMNLLNSYSSIPMNSLVLNVLRHNATKTELFAKNVVAVNIFGSKTNWVMNVNTAIHVNLCEAVR